MDQIRVNRVYQRNGKITKQRRYWAGPVIGMGNLFLYYSNSHISMFRQAYQWQAWELHSYELLYAQAGEAIGNAKISIIPFAGKTLREYLECGKLTPRMMRTAAQELRRVHACFSPLRQSLWTHGDPHLDNFLFDELTSCVHLIDFETQHEDTMPLVQRQADDLLVLLLDLLGRDLSEDWQQHARSFLTTYDNALVLTELQKRIVLPTGWERLLWKTRTHYLPYAILVRRITTLNEIIQTI